MKFKKICGDWKKVPTKDAVEEIRRMENRQSVEVRGLPRYRLV